MKQFGNIIFDGIRNENIFVIQSHPNIFRIFTAKKQRLNIQLIKQYIMNEKVIVKCFSYAKSLSDVNRQVQIQSQRSGLLFKHMV